jgi:hypothetical protein
MGFRLVIEFIDNLHIVSTSNYSAIAIIIIIIIIICGVGLSP